MKDKIPVIIIIVGVITAIFFFNSNKKLEEEILAAENVKNVSNEQVEVYNNIDSHYGRSSNEFYSNKSIVILRGRGATEVIRIYWKKMGEILINSEIITYSGRNQHILSTEWGQIDGQWVPYTITSEADKGYGIVRFKVNNEVFDVLVIVK